MNSPAGRRWRRLVPLLLGVGLAIGVASSFVLSDQEPVPSSRSSRSSKASSSGSNANIESKLDDILANQQAILQKFDAIMEELRIIKVRATLRAGS